YLYLIYCVSYLNFNKFKLSRTAPKIIDKNPERRNERILRICAFFDGQNDARKAKLKIKND
ncbi:hypothetical protein, partial [Brachyspira pilosicoli]|uniref:hypothetical protein n=1 Tax=Brachyspira pilosicoli TaxID=52584 RepID=UPI0015E14BF1